jgi:hypothetical protein
MNNEAIKDEVRLLSRRHQELLEKLLPYFNEEEMAAINKLSTKIYNILSKAGQVSTRKVLVAYGGGKDSSYTVAFVRLLQLRMLEKYGETFIMRVGSMRHGGVPQAVMDNIDRVYRHLELYEDDRAELWVIDHNHVSSFKRDLPMPKEVLDINRTDILMNGHRTAGDGRPTFCNSCNLSVANFYGLACWHEGGVDVVFTGDSKEEQRQYYKWIMGMGSHIGLDIREHRSKGFHGLLKILNDIGQKYFHEMFGPGFEDECQKREIAFGDSATLPEFVTIYDDVSYRVDDHWPLITDFLGFEFDELAFSFTESDCANPALMAHLRGLKAAHVEGTDYYTGIREYLQLATQLMSKKEIPDELQEIVLQRYKDKDAIDKIREKITAFAWQSFGLSETNMIAMVSTPLVNKGLYLESWLRRNHPSLLPRLPEIIDLIAAREMSRLENLALVDELEAIVGLPLRQMQSLYGNTRVDFGDRGTVVSLIRWDDPHKQTIKFVDKNNQEIEEEISGR